MKNVKFNVVIVVTSFLFANILIGQTDSLISQDLKNNGSYLTVDINYISDAVFMGRKDSITAPYLYPSMTYHHKSGFYGTGSLSYLTKSDQSRIDLFLISAGYDFTSIKLSGDISVTKYFFNEDSYNVISEVEADVSAYLTYDIDFMNISVAASTYFNKNSSSDFFLSSELSHDFITNDQKFQISPTAGIHMGSQNFYEEYYINNRIGSDRSSGNGQGSGGGTTVETTTSISIQESEKFNVMAAEFSLPMWYTSKSLTFSFLPALVVPQSKATILVDEVLVEEDLKETFYWMVGLSYKFGQK
ncbi:MAG: hypothetical protein QNK20_11875 [Aureibaculum sp.]|nr:hypothetical protein [Aureibaculum sp.]